MSSHLIGDAIFAPEGCQYFERNITTHFLRSDPERGRVLLVEFVVRMRAQAATRGSTWKEGARIRAVLHSIARDQYEALLLSGVLVCAARTSCTPTSLNYVAGASPDWLVSSGASIATDSRSLRMLEKRQRLEPATSNANNILGNDDPEAILNRMARACTPPQNATRFRADFFLWICFGEDGLRYRDGALGRWSRDQKISARKLGRPSLSRGKNAGHNATPLAAQIVKAYGSRARLGESMMNIYTKAIREDFGCNVVTGEHGFLRYVHPTGAPFPNFAQFRYHVVKHVGLEKVQIAKLGRRLMRHRKQPSKGSFNECVVNALQHVEMDANFVNERPKSFVAGAVHPPLIVARAIDLASGLDTGIGFSLDGEKASAYQIVRFCQAVDKVWFCSLFGLVIEAWQWPSVGVPLKEVVDRGAGANRSGTTEDWDDESASPVRTITPTRQPRSKPTIEATHRRQSRNEEQPHLKESTSTAYELVRRELLRTLQTNESRDVSGRIPLDLETVVRRPCPNALYAALVERGRVDGSHLPVHHAIRQFLKPVKITIERDAAWLHGQRYFSAELVASKLLKKLHRDRACEIAGFALDACVRFIWAEIDNKLLQLELKPISPVDVEVLHVSEADLVALKDLRAARASEFREHQRAMVTETRETYRRITGKGWDSHRTQARSSSTRGRNAAVHRSMSDVFHNRKEAK